MRESGVDGEPRGRLPSLLTCTEEDDLVVQRQLGEVRDPLGPLHQGEELLVCCLADVGDWVVGLQGAVKSKSLKTNPVTKHQLRSHHTKNCTELK